MSRGAQLQVSRTKDIPKPNMYIKALKGEFSSWAFDEERCPQLRGKWRSEVFKASEDVAMDLEIGTGNGFHFGHYAQKHPERNLLGIELKYKPLIQAIRRCVRAGCENARIMRYNAVLIEDLFKDNELNKVFIHFPDPWAKLSQHKHRLIQDEFLKKLFSTQRHGSELEFKTDSRDYFDWAVERFKRSPYQVEAVSYDLHNSEYAEANFVTHFESLFLRKGQPIHYALLTVQK